MTADKILSQDEVDSLLKGVTSGEIETESSKDDTSEIRPYDFTNKEWITRRRMSGLELANDEFSKLFRSSISTLLVKFADVTIESIEMIKFEDFINNIPMPSSINIFTMKPFNGHALFVLEAPLVFAFIDFMFGGSNTEHFKSEGRSFTSIEQSIIRKVVATALHDMKAAWSSIEQVQPEYVKSEINPRFVNIASPTQLVIKIEINIEVEDFKGKMFFCIPYSMVEPANKQLYSTGVQAEEHENTNQWHDVLQEILMNAYTKLTVEIAKTEITFEDLMKFEVGSVISLNKPVSEASIVKIEGLPKFKGFPGQSRGSAAIKLTRILQGLPGMSGSST